MTTEPAPPVKPTPIADETARKDQIWERVKVDTEKFIADAAVLIMGGHSLALVADQFAGMAVRSHPAQTASMMATLLVMTARDRLEEKGLLPDDMPPDPFADEPATQTGQERVTAFLNELTGLVMRHGMAISTLNQQLHTLVTVGADTGAFQDPPLARECRWSPTLGRYVAESPAGDVPGWTVP